jgi:hypothetical protein
MLNKHIAKRKVGSQPNEFLWARLATQGVFVDSKSLIHLCAMILLHTELQCLDDLDSWRRKNRFDVDMSCPFGRATCYATLVGSYETVRSCDPRSLNLDATYSQSLQYDMLM